MKEITTTLSRTRSSKKRTTFPSCEVSSTFGKYSAPHLDAAWLAGAGSSPADARVAERTAVKRVRAVRVVMGVPRLDAEGGPMGVEPPGAFAPASRGSGQDLERYGEADRAAVRVEAHRVGGVGTRRRARDADRPGRVGLDAGAPEEGARERRSDASADAGRPLGRARERTGDAPAARARVLGQVHAQPLARGRRRDDAARARRGQGHRGHVADAVPGRDRRGQELELS